MHPELKQKPGVLWYVEHFSLHILRKTCFKFWGARLSPEEKVEIVFMSISVLSLANGCSQSCTNSPLELTNTEQQRKLSLGLNTEQNSGSAASLELFKHPPQYSKVSVHSPIKSPFSFLICSHSLPWEMKPGSTGDFSSCFHLLLETHAAS